MVENEKNELEGAKNEAEEFLDMKRTLSVKQYQLYEHYKRECREIESQAIEKKNETQTKIQEVNDGFKDSKRRIDEITSQRKKTIK